MTTSPVLQNGAAHPAHTMMAPVAGAPDGEPDIRPEVGRYLVVLKVLSTQLNGTAQQIEQAVVGVCANFQQIAENARKGVSRAAAFLASGKAQDKQRATVAELIEQSRSTFNCLMATLERNAEISRQAVDRMKEVDGQAERISGALKMLESIAEGNHILALNARIEAARAGEFGKGFAVVATEVVAQSDRSRSVINTVSETIRELRGTAASALRDLELQGKQGRESAESQRVQVDQILQAFNDVDREMRSLLRETSSDSEHLSLEIGQAVNKMQFQDRVNQRIAHVVEALDITRERLTTLCGGVESTDTSAVDEILSRYTMKEERSAADAHEEEAAGGEVELF